MQDNSNKQNAKFLGEIETEEALNEAKSLLKRAKNAIDHARRWRKNADADFEDNGIYRLTSEMIESFLSQNKTTFFIGTENGIADIETPPSDN